MSHGELGCKCSSRKNTSKSALQHESDWYLNPILELDSGGGVSLGGEGPEEDPGWESEFNLLQMANWEEVPPGLS